ncbi:MAG: zinc ABC transporter substrate-binding protein [Acidobacteria bacterium]|nr:zinc ABC transporter substrate-binding protein [Acidobacteriota bacterium]
MKNICILFVLFALLAVPALAVRLQVVTTYPYIADLVEQVGQDRVRVHAMAGGQWDPHTIVPKPSFIAKLRRADLLVINGAQLEIGWLPPLMNQANNPRTNVGSSGLLDLSRYVELIDVPTSVSRAHGDIHPDGNPHFHLNPDNIPPLAQAIADRLAEIDMENASFYLNNCEAFTKKWEERLPIWAEKMSALRGQWVIEYHKNYDYLLHHYGIQLLGTVESLPGIPPTSRHIVALEQKIQNNAPRCILQDVYNPAEASEHLARKFDIPMIVLPHDIGAVREAEGIFSLFDEIIRRLTHE